MHGYFASGLFVDIAIGLAVLEGAALTVYHRLTGDGIAPRDFALNLIAGVCLMLALRSALVNAGWQWTTLALTASGVAHGSDLWLRWRCQRRGIRPS